MHSMPTSRLRACRLLLLAALILIHPAAAGTLGVLTYEIKNGEARITDCHESVTGQLVIPAEIEGASVTTIAEGTFSYCNALTSVAIPDSVTSIGDYAFSGCTALTQITIPDGVTAVGRELLFSCTSLTRVTLPDGVTSIGESAFRGCTSLAGITIPNSVTSIGDSAFVDCTALAGIAIPDGVTSIGARVFSRCTSLAVITLPDSASSIGDFAFLDCSALTRVVIPDRVTSIGTWSFSGCTSLISVTLPDGLSSIGDSAFLNCSSLASINIPVGATNMGRGVFAGCASLTHVTIPSGVGSLASAELYDDSWTPLGFSGFFEDCSSLTSITIPDSVTGIGEEAFSGCTSLRRLFFLGKQAPELDGTSVFASTSPHLEIFRLQGSTGFDGPQWRDLSIAIMSLSPEIAVYQPENRELRDNASTAKFGATMKGKVGKSLVFTVTNRGAKTLGPLRIAVSGPHRKDFRIRSRGSSRLELGFSTTFRLQFRPRATGQRTATLRIRSNDPDESPFEIGLQGRGRR